MRTASGTAEPCPAANGPAASRVPLRGGPSAPSCGAEVPSRAIPPSCGAPSARSSAAAPARPAAASCGGRGVAGGSASAPRPSSPVVPLENRLRWRTSRIDATPSPPHDPRPTTKHSSGKRGAPWRARPGRGRAAWTLAKASGPPGPAASNAPPMPGVPTRAPRTGPCRRTPSHAKTHRVHARLPGWLRDGRRPAGRFPGAWGNRPHHRPPALAGNARAHHLPARRCRTRKRPGLAPWPHDRRAVDVKCLNLPLGRWAPPAGGGNVRLPRLGMYRMASGVRLPSCWQRFNNPDAVSHTAATQTEHSTSRVAQARLGGRNPAAALDGQGVLGHRSQSMPSTMGAAKPTQTQRGQCLCPVQRPSGITCARPRPHAGSRVRPKPRPRAPLPPTNRGLSPATPGVASARRRRMRGAHPEGWRPKPSHPPRIGARTG